MKNIQKGSVKVLLLIIAILIIVGGFYFVFYNKTVQKENLESYTSPTGLFSLKYPATWIKSPFGLNGLSNFAALIPLKDKENQILFTATLNVNNEIFDSLHVGLNKAFTKESFGKISGYLTDVYTSQNSPGNTVYSKIYVIDLGQYQKMPVNIIATVVSITKLEKSDRYKIEKEADAVIKTIIIDANKIEGSVQIQKNTVNEARIKGKNAAIKANMNNMRVQAELYYDNHKVISYSGFCKSEEYSKIADEVIKITQTTMVCRDKKEDYVVSSPLVDGGFFCVDSSGVATNTKAMDTKNACEK